MVALPADCRKIVQVAATIAAALIAISACRIPAQATQSNAAQTNHMLVVPANDGYGFEDCLAGNKACGHTIADAWCEAHGMSASVSFGRAEDVTASLPAKSATVPVKLQPGSFIVNCRD